MPVPVEVKKTFQGEKQLVGIGKFLEAYPDAPHAFLFSLDAPDIKDKPLLLPVSGRNVRVLHIRAAQKIVFF